MDRYENLEVLSKHDATGVVLEAYRLDRYENVKQTREFGPVAVLEAYRLDRYENLFNLARYYPYTLVLEAYRLDRYENFEQSALLRASTTF